MWRNEKKITGILSVQLLDYIFVSQLTHNPLVYTNFYNTPSSLFCAFFFSLYSVHVFVFKQSLNIITKTTKLFINFACLKCNHFIQHSVCTSAPEVNRRIPAEFIVCPRICFMTVWSEAATWFVWFTFGFVEILDTCKLRKQYITEYLSCHSTS